MNTEKKVRNRRNEGLIHVENRNLPTALKTLPADRKIALDAIQEKTKKSGTAKKQMAKRFQNLSITPTNARHNEHNFTTQTPSKRWYPLNNDPRKQKFVECNC